MDYMKFNARDNNRNNFNHIVYEHDHYYNAIYSASEAKT